MSGLDHVRSEGAAPLQFRVLGPDSPGPAPADLRRLFRGQRLSAGRRSRFDQTGRVVALCGHRVVGLAAYERTDRELRVTEVGLDHESGCGLEPIVGGLLDALELACLASGARRLILLPRAATAGDVLARRGYASIAEGAAGSWFQKTFA